MSTIGARIAANGWLQGSVLRDDDLRSLSERYSFKMHRVADVIGLVVSQSCDLTYDWLEGEPWRSCSGTISMVLVSIRPCPAAAI